MLKNELIKLYKSVKKQIIDRINDFKKIWSYKMEEEIFDELIFCHLTPQSKAKLCWQAVQDLKKYNIYKTRNLNHTYQLLNKVRFKYKKSRYIIKTINNYYNNGNPIFSTYLIKLPDIMKKREWLVKNIKGLGYKEASHFLRNIGLYDKIAILDRHILRNLYSFNIINEIPESISKYQYIDIENKMKTFSKEIRIPLSHMDILLWYKETGEIFK